MTIPAMPTAAGILQAGINHMADRAVSYDAPQGERSIGMTIDMFNVLVAKKLKEPLSEEDGWNFMELLKLVRSKQGEFKADSYEDRAAYAGLAAEAAYKDRVALPVIGDLRGGNREHKLAPDLGAMGAREPIGADLRFDQSGRQDAIEQNGNTGEHYLPEGLSWDEAPADAIALVSGDGKLDDTNMYVWVPAVEGRVLGLLARAFNGRDRGSAQGCDLSHPGSVWRIVARRPEAVAA